MGYNEYYRKPDVYASLVDKGYVFRTALYRLGSPELADASRPLTFVLGGFNPHTGIHESFVKFTKALHDNAQDKHVLLDMNSQPFDNLTHPQRFPYKVQARLERLPLPKNSVSFMVLDSTIEFMNNNQASDFFSHIPQALTKDGIILTSIILPRLLRFWDTIMRRRNYQVDAYVRDINDVTKLASPHLKTVLAAHFDARLKKAGLVAFARNDSVYPEFKGQPLFYTDDAFSHYPHLRKIALDTTSE